MSLLTRLLMMAKRLIKPRANNFIGGEPVFGITWKTVLPFIAKLLSGVIMAVSPEVRTDLTNFVQDLHKKAVSTNNPWDAVLSTLLADVLGITLS